MTLSKHWCIFRVHPFGWTPASDAPLCHWCSHVTNKLSSYVKKKNYFPTVQAIVIREQTSKLSKKETYRVKQGKSEERRSLDRRPLHSHTLWGRWCFSNTGHSASPLSITVNYVLSRYTVSPQNLHMLLFYANLCEERPNRKSTTTSKAREHSDASTAPHRTLALSLWEHMALAEPGGNCERDRPGPCSFVQLLF